MLSASRVGSEGCLVVLAAPWPGDPATDRLPLSIARREKGLGFRVSRP